MVSPPSPRATSASCAAGPTLVLEARLWRRGVAEVAGVDEVGVGPLAGPVMAAAVVLPRGERVEGVDDSKRLTPSRRLAVAERVRALARGWALGAASAAEVDQVGIFEATRRAKRRALAALLRERPEVAHVLVDGLRVAGLPVPQTAIVGGDGLSQSIAAASVVAKVARDAHMEAQDGVHPGYGFGRHKGYGTALHLEALARLGPCVLHRQSFRPVAAAAATGSAR